MDTPSLSAWVLTIGIGDWYRFEGIASLSRLQKGPHGEIVGKSQGRQAEEDEATHFEEMLKAVFLVTRDLKNLWNFARL